MISPQKTMFDSEAGKLDTEFCHVDNDLLRIVRSILPSTIKAKINLFIDEYL